MENAKKLTILGQILEYKDVLFGRFSDKLTHEDKINKWKEIAETLRSLGVFNRDWKFLRDTTWQNWRKRTLEKRDNRLQTGSAGGKKFKYDDCDELVLKIIGKSSPVINGLVIPESSGTNQADVTVEQGTPDVNAPEVPAEALTPGTPITPILPAITGTFRKNPRTISEAASSDELNIIKVEKMKLEKELIKEKIEIAAREKYKLTLEIYKLEKQLGIVQPSQFTIPLHLEHATIIVHESTEDDVENEEE